MGCAGGGVSLSETIERQAPEEQRPTLLEVQCGLRLGSLGLNVQFTASAAWTVLFGPSGSGKSTLLRVIAGLEKPETGRVRVLGQTVFDAAAGTWVRTEDRPVRWAGQESFLFSGMTVAENLECGGGDTAGALRHFGLGGLADKRPAELSGGQRQMVSVVRAAMSAPGKLLLLDEPFSGLDAEVRDGLMGGLREWLAGSPVVSVTHDVGEAFLLGAEVVKMGAGRIVAQGAVGQVLGEERLRLVGVLGSA